MTTPRVVTFDWDAFHAHVERLRVVHDQRTPAEAVAVSLDAFRRWGVEPPASFLQTHPEAAAVCRPGAN
jgi:hypothetical protein